MEGRAPAFRPARANRSVITGLNPFAPGRARLHRDAVKIGHEIRSSRHRSRTLSAFALDGPLLDPRTREKP